MAATDGGTSTGLPNSFRTQVEKAFSQVSGLLKHSLGPVNAKYPYQPSNDPDPATGGFLADLRAMTPFSDIKTLLESFYDQAKGVQDDDTLLLERLVDLLSKLPSNSKLGQELTDGFINQLWGALPHPPVVSLGTKYKYRDADGGNNNIAAPDVGRANTPYARSCKPMIMQNIALPSPESIFDSLMDRGEHFEEHPNKVSSMLFYLASIIIHDLFRTDHVDFNNSLTSSYLDLAPLYGSNEDEQKLMRTFKGGKLKPDCFSEKRLIGFPPGVSVILIMFNRFHNYIVANLAAINENGRFNKPASTLTGDKLTKAWIKYDNDLFQTARLINCGLYVNIILKDYVRTILNLNRTPRPWDLDPRAVSTKTLLNTPAPEGIGNQVSAEFNLIYRWHSAISQRDEKWTEGRFKSLGIAADTELKDLIPVLIKWEAGVAADPHDRQFADLKREGSGPDSKYNDDDLVKILTESIEDVAGSFGANKVPKIMRSIEMLGIIQARSWNLGSLNEFRSFFGLNKHKDFTDINPDPQVAEKLKNLYDSPDCVELYPGLVAEKAKPPIFPGSGLCVNFTTSRAILSDAVGLVRGDRFYTTDYTPRNLTNWGYTEVDYDLTVNEGCVFYKLIYRSFPNHFKGNSVYAYFPFVIPDENKVILKELGRDQLFDWSKPKRMSELLEVKSYRAITTILNDQQNFKVTWGPSIAYAVLHPGKKYGIDYCLAGDNKPNAESRALVMKGLYPKDWKAEVKGFYQQITQSLLKKYSYKMGKANQVDIVRDVVSLANTHFSASLFSLPLKTDDHPHGIYTEQELYQVLCVSFFAIFYDIDSAKSFLLTTAAQILTEQLGDLVLFNTEAIQYTGRIADWIAKLHEHTTLTEYGMHMIQRLLESGQSIKDVVWTTIIPTASSMVANQTQLFTQVLDFYLLDANKAHLAALVTLAHTDTPAADTTILHYFLEGARLTNTVGVFRDVLTNSSISDGGVTINAPAGSRLFINLRHASMDPKVFPEPEQVKLDRDLKSYIHYGWGPHQCAGMEISQLAMATVLKEVVKLKGLKRVLGPQGVVKSVPAQFGYLQYMLPDWSGYYPVPTTMKIMWDD